MSAPEDREAGLPISALLQLSALGGELPEPIVGKGDTLSARLVRLGWKILPIPRLDTIAPAGVGMRFISFFHTYEWLIVPPEDSPIRARKAVGSITAIRTAWRLATLGDDDTPITGEG